METLHGPLVVDMTKGKHRKFWVAGIALVFADSFFQTREQTSVDPFTKQSNTIRVRELNDEGRKLFNQLDALGGKGVTVTGESSEEGNGYFIQRTLFVASVTANPAQDPKLDPILIGLLQDKERADAIKREQEREAVAQRLAEDILQKERAAEIVEAERAKTRRKQPA